MATNVGWNLKIINKYKITTIDVVKVIRKKYTEPTWNDNTYSAWWKHTIWRWDEE